MNLEKIKEWEKQIKELWEEYEEAEEEKENTRIEEKSFYWLCEANYTRICHIQLLERFIKEEKGE